MSLLPILIIILFFNNIFSKKNTERKEEASPRFLDLLKWGVNNSLNISEKVKLSKENKFVAEKFVGIDDIILDIPPELMLDINKTLSLLKSKKLRKQYELYVKEDKEAKLKNQTIEDDSHIDQSFLSYIFYLVSHKPKKFEKSKFYDFFQKISYMFEDNLDRLPFFYSSEQMRLFQNTTFGSVFETLNRYTVEEASIFEKKIYKKPILFEDYLKYRIFSVKKYYNNSIVPFIDLIKQDFNEPNCIYYEENGHIKVRAILNVFPKEDIILKPDNISNQHRLIFYGETFDEIIDIFPSYDINTVSYKFLKDQNIDITNDISLNEKIRKINMIDLMVPEFYKYIEDIYMDLSKYKKKKNKEVNELDAYRLFLRYLKKLRKNLDVVDDFKIRESFYNQTDIKNAMRIFKGERMLLDKKIDELRKHIKNFKNFKKILDKSNNGHIDIEDL